MAVVYRARHVRLGRPVALKLLAPELATTESFQRRFIRESQLAASIEHPNNIPIYEAGKTDNLLYIAMRYVEGFDLAELLEREGPLSIDRAIVLFQQAASALDAAHARGLVHRDVKPGNILVSPGGRPDGTDHVYLTDFGLTKRTDSLTGLTGTGSFIGTLDYIAPEQISGTHVDGRADVYALGCVLFRAFAGVTPFERESDVAVMYGHLSQPPPKVTSFRPDLPSAIDGVLAKAMAKRPEDRYPSCYDLISDLRAAAAGVGSPIAVPTAAAGAATKPDPARAIRPPDTQTPDRRRGRKRSGRVLAALGLLVVLAAGAAVAAGRGGPGAARGPDAVVLPFAVEKYPSSGVEVSRTWTLSGRKGDHVRGELRVRATKPARSLLYELLPREMTPLLARVVFTPQPQILQPLSAVTYQLDGATSQSWTLVYEVPVDPGPLTLERLRRWAVAQENARLAPAFRNTQGATQPLLVGSLQLAPAGVLELRAGAAPHLLTITGRYDGNRAAPADVVAGARYLVDRPRVVSVDRSGQVTPRSAGTATVTVILGPLSAATLVVVSPPS